MGGIAFIRFAPLDGSGAPQTRAEALAADIEKMIAERGLAPGDLIGTMDEFRDRSGFGRATISSPSGRSPPRSPTPSPSANRWNC
ncbi:hypothetical protein [Actinomadura sp. NTSP31]|uniref:hypothetical protein n=1 Tax=Actinomadura sp. NTSP31 TaxID=1735447 RepID=UPI0035C0E986